MGKLATPDWIKEGYDSKQDYEKAKGKTKKVSKGKTFKIKKCLKCDSGKIEIILSQNEEKPTKEWVCKSCNWKGKKIKEEEVDEDEFLDFVDKLEEK